MLNLWPKSVTPEPERAGNFYSYIRQDGAPSCQQQMEKDLWDSAEELEWSDKQYSVDEFLSLYNLPQIVKVRGGDFDAKQCNLRVGETLVLHKLSAMKKVLAKDGKGRELYLPLVSPLKVDIRATNCKKEMYESVHEIAKVMPKCLRAFSGHLTEHFSTSIDMGQKLEILNMDHQKGILVCRDCDSGKVHYLLNDCQAIFYPVADPKEYTIEELVQNFKLPLSVQFVQDSLPSSHSALQMEILSASGIIRIERPLVDDCIIASSKTSGQRTAAILPRDRKFVVSPAYDALRHRPYYSKLCGRFEHAINFAGLEAEAMADVFNKKGRRYNLVGGLLIGGGDLCSDGEDDDDYETISDETDVPPRIPPKPVPPAVAAKPTSTRPGQKPPIPDKPVRHKPQVATTQKSPEEPPTSQFTNSNPSSPLEEESVTSENEYDFADDDDGRIYESIDEIEVIKPPRPPRRPSSASAGQQLDEKSLDDNKPQSINYQSGSLVDSFPNEEPCPVRNNPEDKPPKSPGLGRIPTRYGSDRPKMPPPETAPKPNSAPKSPVLDNPGGLEPRDATGQISPAGLSTSQTTNDNFLPLPNNLKELTVSEVCACLQDLKMSQYVSTFQTEEIDGGLLVELDEDSLLSLGMTKFHCKKLLNFINGWRPRMGLTSS